jgi:hypothetical protein
VTAGAGSVDPPLTVTGSDGAAKATHSLGPTGASQTVSASATGLTPVEFVATVDRSRISERTEIGDASEADASVGLEQFLRDHGTGAVPEELYDRYVQESIDCLRQSAAAPA